MTTTMASVANRARPDSSRRHRRHRGHGGHGGNGGHGGHGGHGGREEFSVTRNMTPGRGIWGGTARFLGRDRMPPAVPCQGRIALQPSAASERMSHGIRNAAVRRQWSRELSHARILDCPAHRPRHVVHPPCARADFVRGHGRAGCGGDRCSIGPIRGVTSRGSAARRSLRAVHTGRATAWRFGSTSRLRSGARIDANAADDGHGAPGLSVRLVSTTKRRNGIAIPHGHESCGLSTNDRGLQRPGQSG